MFLQKQPSRVVLRKRCSENMLQIYRRTPMWKFDFNKVGLQLCWNHTSAWVLSCKFTAYSQNTFFQEHLWMPASVLRNFEKFRGKIPVPESFPNKVIGWSATLLKKRVWHRWFSCQFCEISKNTFFHRTSPVTASDWNWQYLQRMVLIVTQ